MPNRNHPPRSMTIFRNLRHQNTKRFTAYGTKSIDPIHSSYILKKYNNMAQQEGASFNNLVEEAQAQPAAAIERIVVVQQQDLAVEVEEDHLEIVREDAVRRAHFSFFDRINTHKAKLLRLISIVVFLLIAMFPTLLDSNSCLLRPIPPQPSGHLFISKEETVFKSYEYFKIMEENAEKMKQNSNNSFNQSAFQKMTYLEYQNIYKVVKALLAAYDLNPTYNEQILPSEIYEDFQDDIPYVNLSFYFNPVKNQKKCASCYAFPITAVIQYMYKRFKGKEIKLSEQQLIDCTSPRMNGCEMGNLSQNIGYTQEKGLVLEMEYPYESMDGVSMNCNNKIVNSPDKQKFKVSGFHKLTESNCRAIRQQLANNIPVVAMINAEELYDLGAGEVYMNCRERPFTHAVTIVGHTEGGKEWIVRNSWGTSWGDNGYFLLGGGNTCGICQHTYAPYFSK